MIMLCKHYPILKSPSVCSPDWKLVAKLPSIMATLEYTDAIVLNSLWIFFSGTVTAENQTKSTFSLKNINMYSCTYNHQF